MKKAIILLAGIVGLAGCTSDTLQQNVSEKAVKQCGTGPCPIVVVAPRASVTPRQAAWGEQITISLNVSNTRVRYLSIEDIVVKFTILGSNSIQATLPSNIYGGPNPISVVFTNGTSNNIVVKLDFSVLGESAISDELTVTLNSGVGLDRILNRILQVNREQGLRLEYVADSHQQISNISDKNSPCARYTIRIKTNGAPLGMTIENLLNQGTGENLIYNVDPQSIAGLIQTSQPLSITNMEADHKSEIGLALAHNQGFYGDGVTIAVIDSGLNGVSDLNDRFTLFPTQLGVDVARNDVALSPDGHGTLST
jgi:hypothetical protein